MSSIPVWSMTFLKILTPFSNTTGVDNGGKQPENLSPNFSVCSIDTVCTCIYRGLGKPKIESSAFSALT